jgi:hypothetical protein
VLGWSLQEALRSRVGSGGFQTTRRRRELDEQQIAEENLGRGGKGRKQEKKEAQSDPL